VRKLPTTLATEKKLSSHGTDYAPAWRNLQFIFHDAMQHTPVLRVTSLAQALLQCDNFNDRMIAF
jgi:hypothetical protein